MDNDFEKGLQELEDLLEDLLLLLPLALCHGH